LITTEELKKPLKKTVRLLKERVKGILTVGGKRLNKKKDQLIKHLRASKERIKLLKEKGKKKEIQLEYAKAKRINKQLQRDMPGRGGEKKKTKKNAGIYL
jgi:hypothetical protein